MYYTLSDDLQVNLVVFRTAEESLKQRLCELFSGGAADWMMRTDLATHEDADVQMSYKAWMQCRNAIDKTRTSISEKEESPIKCEAE